MDVGGEHQAWIYIWNTSVSPSTISGPSHTASSYGTWLVSGTRAQVTIYEQTAMNKTSMHGVLCCQILCLTSLHITSVVNIVEEVCCGAASSARLGLDGEGCSCVKQPTFVG